MQRSLLQLLVEIFMHCSSTICYVCQRAGSHASIIPLSKVQLGFQDDGLASFAHDL